MSSHCTDEPCVSKDNSTDKQVEQPENRSVIEALKRLFFRDAESQDPSRRSVSMPAGTPRFTSTKNLSLDEALDIQLSGGWVEVHEKRLGECVTLVVCEHEKDDAGLYSSCDFLNKNGIPFLLEERTFIRFDEIITTRRIVIFLDKPLGKTMLDNLRRRCHRHEEKYSRFGRHVLPSLSSKFYNFATKQWEGIEALIRFDEIASTEKLIQVHSEWITEDERDLSLHSEGSMVPDSLFCAMGGTTEMVIDEVIAKGHFGFLAAPEKSFKSYVSLDAAISVATGTPFLNRFAVPQKRKVLLISNETQIADYKRQRAAILTSKGLDPNTPLDNLFWNRSLFDLSDSEGSLERFRKVCRDNPDCLMIIDPFNHCLGDLASQNSNKAVMTSALSRWSAITEQFGVTLLINHHTNDSLYPRAEPARRNMSHVGPESWGRYHVMMNELKPYNNDEGTMQLFFFIEGNAQIGGKFVLSIDEGANKDHWKPSITTLKEHKERKAAAKIEATDSALESIQRAILAGLATKETPQSVNAISNLPGVQVDRTSVMLRQALEALVSDNKIKCRSKKTGEKTFNKYELIG